jgi:hypothetical protein
MYLLYRDWFRHARNLGCREPLIEELKGGPAIRASIEDNQT